MGVLDRVVQMFKQGKSEESAAALELVRLSGAGMQSVVGESNYQPELKAVVDGRSVAERDLDHAIRVQAVLVPEPKNRHDRHAVRVDVSGRTVGYLPREDAVRYQPVLLDLEAAGRAGWCEGRVMGGGKRRYGVFLRLGPPDFLVPVNSGDGLDVLEPDAHVKATKVDGDAVGRWVKPGGRVAVFFSFEPFTLEKGKCAGDQAWQVLVDGVRVGELTPLMSRRYEQSFSSVTTPGCEGFLSWSEEKGPQVELMLPKVAERG